MGVPLDDTWIHFQFADNFAKGYFYQYNPGEPTAGTTSPLYVIVLGSISFIIKNFIVSSIFISALFHFLSCIFIYKLSLLIFESEYSPLKDLKSAFSPKFISLMIAMLSVLAGRFTWSALSGMETTMFTFFCIAGIYFHVMNIQLRKFNLLPVVFLALATVSRPEGYLLCLLYFGDTLANLIKDGSFKRYFFKLLSAVGIFLILTLPYLIFSYSISGHFFPNTYRGQGGGFSILPNTEYLRIAFTYFFRDNLITGFMLMISIPFYIINFKKYFSKFRSVYLIILCLLILPFAFSIFIPNWRHHVRYLIPLIPFVNIITVYVLVSLMDGNHLLRLKSFIFKDQKRFACILIFSFVYFTVFAVALGKNTDNINSQQVKLAEWVHENVRRDETIALNDIGAITFINKNRIIDMAGLVTPEILRYRTYQLDVNLDSTNSLLKKNNVAYIIIYDNWYKEFLNKYKDNLTFVTSAVLEENTICGGIEMKVYKTNFNTKE